MFKKSMLMMVALCSTLPAFAMKKKIEPEEAFFRALIKPSNLRLAGDLLENGEILKPALAYAYKLFKSRVIEFAQAERRPWMHKLTTKNRWGEEVPVKVKNAHVCFLRLLNAASVLRQLEWIKEGISAKREFVNRDFRMGHGYNAAYGYRAYDAGRDWQMNRHEEEMRRERQWRELEYKSEQDARRIREQQEPARVQPMQLEPKSNFDYQRKYAEAQRQRQAVEEVERVQMPVRQEKPRYTFQDARQAVARGNVALLVEILDANVLSAASVQDLLGAACDMGNDEIVQLLFAKVEQFNAPVEAKVISGYQFNPGGNSNND